MSYVPKDLLDFSSDLLKLIVRFEHPADSVVSRYFREQRMREYLPKGEDLSRFTQSELDLIAFRLNTRPRKSLGWKCLLELLLPESAFDSQAYWGSIGKPVALGV